MTDFLSQWRNRIDQCKQQRRRFISDWQTNVDYRRGKPFDTDSDQDRIALTVDWSMTKAKQALLFSQVPEVVLTAKQPAFEPAVPVFQKVLNDTLTKARVGVAMDEVLPDCINVAGIGAVIVSYETRTDEVQVPAVDPATLPPQHQLAVATGAVKIPMVPVKRVVDQAYRVQRISPSDLLWPTEFTGSDFDDAYWIGRTGRMTKTEAKHAYNLTDEQLSKASDGDRSQYALNKQLSQAPNVDEDMVSFDEIFYKRHAFHPEELYFDAIHHLVFIDGITEPVVDEPWKGQQFDPQTGRYVGACQWPIRILTLTYISDEPIPPSDTAMGRPQVDELIKSRTQMILQREHSLPIRWFDVNRIDPNVQDALMRGTWQGMIPIEGSGASAIGEVARANYPREDFEFQNIAMRDLQQVWQVGDNQLGSLASGARSAQEVSITQQNFQTRIGYERARVSSFFVGIADVCAGLLALYGDFTVPAISQQDAQSLQAWDRRTINQQFVFTIRPDSTVVRDANQRLKEVIDFFNYAAKTGYLQLEPILREMAALTGFDPNEVIVPPTPRGPDESNVSLRLTGAADLRDPLALAMLVKTGQAPAQDNIAAAIQILKSIGAVPPAPAPSPLVPLTGAESIIPGAAPFQAPPMPPPGGPQAPAPENLTLADRLNTRREE